MSKEPKEPKEKLPLDLRKIRKGGRMKHKDGRTMLIQGMYLGGDGPVLMVKLGPAQAVAQNVPISEVDDLD